MAGFICLVCNAVFSQDYKFKDLVEQYKFEDTSFFKTVKPEIEKELLTAQGKEKVIAHLALAQILTSRKQHEKALSNYFTALSLAGRLNDRLMLYHCHFKIGSYYYLTESSTLTTIKHFYTAKKLYEGDKHDLGYFTLLRRIGFIEIVSENFDLAEKTYLELISLLPYLSKKPDVSFIYNNLADIYISARKFEKGKSNLDTTLKLTLQSGDSTAIARCYVNYGSLYREKKEFIQALEYYQLAYRIQANNKLISNGMECLVYQGMTNKHLHRYAMAASQLQTANDYCEKTKHDALNIILLPHLAECYAALKQHALAYKMQKRFYELDKVVDAISEKGTIKKYNDEFAFEKKLIEDSLRYSKKNLELAFENKKQLALQEQQYKQWILIISFSLVFILAISIIIYINQKQKNKLRLKISEIKALQSQMNPHFIFNSLNSVLEFISKSQTNEAIKYLTRFSRLIRLVLEFSNRKAILISEELEMLKLYMELENVRMEIPFNYSITVDDTLDVSAYEIPAMLLQPFVENSIIHGILNKAKLAELEGKAYMGELKINLSATENDFKCVVEDNGVGMEKALEIKNKKSHNHLSLGMRITKNRLDLIGEKQGRIEYFDLKDENGNAKGTRVEILIPLTETF